MKRGIASVILCIWTMIIYAHSPVETHASISLHNDELLINIELPWTITDAAEQAYYGTELETLEKIKQYIADRMQVEWKGQPVSPTMITPMESLHSHGGQLLLHFPVQSLEDVTISNTIMTDIHEKQRNFHTIQYTDGSAAQYITTQETPSFSLNTSSFLNDYLEWIILGAVLVVITILLVTRKYV